MLRGRPPKKAAETSFVANYREPLIGSAQAPTRKRSNIRLEAALTNQGKKVAYQPRTSKRGNEETVDAKGR